MTKIASQNCLSRFNSVLPSVSKLYPSSSFKRIVDGLFSVESFTADTILSWNSIFEQFTATRRFPHSIFLFKKLLQSSSVKANCFTFPPVLRACTSLRMPKLGFSLHGYLIKCGFGTCFAPFRCLIDMYLSFGNAQDAFRLFEEMPDRDAPSYFSFVCSLGSKGFYEEVLDVFEDMTNLGFLPNLDSVFYAILGCIELRRIDRGASIHCFLVQNGFSTNLRINNLLISMYNKSGRLDLGRQVFNDMPERDVVSWNSIITGYAQIGDWSGAFSLFLSMKKVENLLPSRVTFLGLVLACGQSGNLDIGKSIHGHLIRLAMMSDFQLGTSVMDMYLKCGEIEHARVIFEEELLEKSLVSWNSLIAGYSQNGYCYEAVLLFQQIVQDASIEPDSITIANVVPACASMTDLQLIKLMHTFVIKKGLRLENDTVLGTAMVDAYCKCSDVETASALFTGIAKPSTATWNAMISGYTLNRHVHQSMQLFLTMLLGDVPSDSITMVILFQSCGELGSLNVGRMIHGYCLSKGFSSHLTVNNAMIDMYMRCGCTRSSQLLFNLMPYKNVVSWNTMLYGYVKVNDSAMALKIFHEMQLENQHKPDYVTMISVIQAYAANSVNHGGPMVHGLVLKLGLQSEILVANSLLDAYAKNGLIDRAWSLFDQMGWLRDQTSWNVMIAGCGMNGQGKKACELLLQMEENGYKPNSITFISLLSSCSHSGLIDEGCRYFNTMITQYKIQPSLEHWTCIIDMFGRAGRLEVAYLLIKSEIGFGFGGLSDCAAIWAALLSACRTNMNVDIGELASQHLFKLAPHNCGHYSLLSNLYAFGKRWDDAANMRRVFEDGRLMKKPGLSLVKV